MIQLTIASHEAKIALQADRIQECHASGILNTLSYLTITKKVFETLFFIVYQLIKKKPIPPVYGQTQLHHVPLKARWNEIPM